MTVDQTYNDVANIKREKARKAAAQIAALLYADLEIEVDPTQVERFIKSRWGRVAPLAHIVHDAPDFTK